MPWSCPDCRYYTNHTNFVCPRCHLGGLYDVRTEAQLRMDGYEHIEETSPPAEPPPVRRSFWQDVMTLSCAGWLIQSAGRLLRWAVILGAIALLIARAETLLPSLLERAAPILPLCIVLWLLWSCFRRILKP